METIAVTSDDGWTAPLRVCAARRGTPAREPIVSIVPGIGVPAGYYELLARALSKHGLDVAICELNGAAAGTPADFGYHAIVTRYLDAHVAATTRRFGGRPVVFVGHSIGGQLATLYAACNPERVRGLALVASGSNYQRCYSPVVRGVLLLAASMARNIKLPPGDIKSLWSALCEYPPAFQADWAQVVRNGSFTFTGENADYERRLAGLVTDILAIDIRNDWLAPRASIEHLLGKTPQARVTWWQEPGSGHNGWILDFTATVDRLNRWLDAITAAPLDRAGQS